MTEQSRKNQEMTKRDFVGILKRNGFIDKNSQVTRVRSSTNWNEFNFEVITRHGMNIGNLISIEEKFGLALLYVGPSKENGQIYAKFGPTHRFMERKGPAT